MTQQFQFRRTRSGKLRRVLRPGGPGITGWLYRVFVYWPFVNPFLRLGGVGRGIAAGIAYGTLWDPFLPMAMLGLVPAWVIWAIAAFTITTATGTLPRPMAPLTWRSPEGLTGLISATVIGFALIAVTVELGIDDVPMNSGSNQATLNQLKLYPLLVAWFLWFMTILGAFKKRPARVSHGSAAFLTGIENLVTGEGLMIGRAGSNLPARYAGQVLTNPDPRHMVTVASNGSGKGVSAIIPNLLTYEGSVLAIDPKGELAAITGRRRRDMGQDVYVLDPWGLSGVPSAAFNPLSILTDENPDIVEDAALITDALVFDDGGSDPYWNLEARNLLQGLILHIATDYSIADEDRTLIKLRELLTLDADSFDQLLQEMATNIGANGAVARIAGALSAMPEKQFGSIRSTARVSTDFLESQRMARVLGRTDFQLTALKTRPTTIFLRLPAGRLASHSRWLRMIIALALEAMERERSRPAQPVVFLMDEFATLGHMRSVENAIGQIRGFGVKLWPVLQDLNQLKALYKDRWETFLGNAGTVQFFGINDQFTAQYVSRLLGEQTIMVTSETKVTSDRSTLSTSERGRALLTPDEVRRLSPNQQIVLMQGESGLLADKLCYFADPEFDGLFDDNPLHG